MTILSDNIRRLHDAAILPLASVDRDHVKWEKRRITTRIAKMTTVAVRTMETTLHGHLLQA